MVDYKTDAMDTSRTGDAAARYRLQGGSYALIAQRATGKPVKEVVFLFLQADRAEVLTDVLELVVEAEAAALSHLDGGT